MKGAGRRTEREEEKGEGCKRGAKDHKNQKKQEDTSQNEVIWELENLGKGQ